MKFQVTYYDIESDRTITKICYNCNYENNGDEFCFTPVDDPVKIYRAIIIKHPRVSITINKDFLSIDVVGYQCMKSGGYWITNTTIRVLKENE